MSDSDLIPTGSILVATDFSTTAQAGVDWALEIARNHGTGVILVHALLLPNRATDFVPTEPGITESLWQAAQSRMDEAAAAAREKDVEVTAEVRLGIASEALLEAIEEHDPHLVVIGTRGHTGLKHLLSSTCCWARPPSASCSSRPVRC